MQSFAASPGTFKINALGELVSPIIGWLYVTGTRADPIFPVGQTANLGKGDGIVFPGGVVVDVETGKFFPDVEDWKAREGISAEALDDDAPEGPDTRPIVMGRAVGKRKSYWLWPAAQAVFARDTNQLLPDDPRVEKSTGKEYAEWIEKGWSIIDPVTGEEIRSNDEPETETPEEPETPDADEDGDDGMSFV